MTINYGPTILSGTSKEVDAYIDFVMDIREKLNAQYNTEQVINKMGLCDALLAVGFSVYLHYGTNNATIEKDGKSIIMTHMEMYEHGLSTYEQFWSIAEKWYEAK
jgi:hypothetical protein